LEALLFEVSGNPFEPTYSLPKILWFRQNRPEVYQAARTFLQSNSFIAYRLTGGISQDVSQGYGMHCFNMRTGVWNEAICRSLGIHPSILPDIYPCHAVIGGITDHAARRIGLLPGTPVVAGGLDAACGTLGAGVVRPGETQEQGGQAGGMSICIDSYAADKRLILSRHVVPDRWLLQGGSVGGGMLRWLREESCPELSFEEMSALADTVPPGSDGLICLPYMAGERSPIWNPYAKGVLFGLSYRTTRAHLIRAAMEGVAYALLHNLEVAREAGCEPNSLRAMGGAANSFVWTQIKADITGKKIEVPASDTATTLGAAILAGIGVGIYPTAEDAVCKTIQVKREHAPDPKSFTVYQKGYQTYRTLYETTKPMLGEV
ncbi:MAG: FGGY-family carbohydrate kinase, partial [Clostridia bacterium]|nr:FGGY-family carbohydrate kinase [Clostridia bacterium]